MVRMVGWEKVAQIIKTQKMIMILQLRCMRITLYPSMFLKRNLPPLFLVFLRLWMLLFLMLFLRR